MRKLLLLSFLFLGVGLFTACSDDDDDITISKEQLPKAGVEFIDTYFSNLDIRKIEKKNNPDRNGTLYEIKYKSGLEVDLDANGNWTSVEQNDDKAIENTTFIMTPITDYIATTYPGQGINSIDKRTDGSFKVELTNDQDLFFNQQGEPTTGGNVNPGPTGNIKLTDLPTISQEFISTYFEGEEVAKVEKKNKPDTDGTLYEVDFKSGLDIDFNEAGDWTSVDQANDGALPNVEFINEPIKDYVKANYPDKQISSIEKTTAGFEVDLTKKPGEKDIELLFDKDGKFQKIKVD